MVTFLASQVAMLQHCVSQTNLNCYTNQRPLVSEAEDPGWYRGRLEESNQFGIFPGNYVRFEEEAEAATTSTVVVS